MKNAAHKVIGVLGMLLATTSVTLAQGNRDRKEQTPPSIKQIFKDLDTNEDGKISLKEVKGPLKKDFKKIDTNEDGFLSKKEIKKALKPKRKKRPRN
jgi:Ca2+-binding EF-hand superfamily protein